MLRKILGKRAQSTAEYAILISIVVGAVVAMQVYVRRGLQSRIRDVVNHEAAGGDVGGQAFNFTDNGQYEPYYTDSEFNSNRDAQINKTEQAGGAATTAIQGQDVSTRTGYQEAQVGRAENN